MKVDPKKMEVVKKTVSVAAPTGGGRLARLIADSKKLADGREVKVVKKTSPGMPGSGKPAQMGEVVITASPIKKATTPEATKPDVKKEAEFGTYTLPDVIKISGYNIDANAYKRALKKAEMTYGSGSRELRILRDVAGNNFSMKSTFKKPDMRGDTNSYVDTAQTVYNKNKYNERAGYVMNQDSDDFDAINLLRTLGELKGQRNLSNDKKAVDRND